MNISNLPPHIQEVLKKKHREILAGEAALRMATSGTGPMQHDALYKNSPAGSAPSFRRPGTRLPPEEGLNKTEVNFLRMMIPLLQPLAVRVLIHPQYIFPDGSRYIPDFAVIVNTGGTVIYEVKGGYSLRMMKAEQGVERFRRASEYLVGYTCEMWKLNGQASGGDWKRVM